MGEHASSSVAVEEVPVRPSPLFDGGWRLDKPRSDTNDCTFKLLEVTTARKWGEGEVSGMVSTGGGQHHLLPC